MTLPEKETRTLRVRESDHQEKKLTLTHTLSIAACAVCFLLAFSFLHGTQQLLLISLGVMLIGGSR
jgi:hypothetical protein